MNEKLEDSTLSPITLASSKNSTLVSPDENENEKSPSPPPAYLYDRRERKLDHGDNIVRQRKHWFQLWLPKGDPPLIRETLAEAPLIPLVNASFFSILTFGWMSPMMTLGYHRTLQATDLWKLDDSRSASYLSTRLEEAWDRRVAQASDYNARLERGEIQPSLFWRLRHFRSSSDKNEKKLDAWRMKSRKRPSLVWALNDVLWKRFWLAGAYKVFGDVSQMMCPLLVRAIINYGKKHYAAHHPPAGTIPPKAPDLATGILMAIALLILTIFQALGQQHFFWRSMSTGVYCRAALISSAFKRGLYLTPKARKKFDNARLVHFCSGDISRVEQACQLFHASWTTPIQVGICLAILLVQLGPSALAGFALFLLLIPMQRVVVKHQSTNRKAASEWSDKRMSLLTECLSGMKVVKWFCYENKFLERIAFNRKRELKGIWKIQLNGSVNLAMAYSVPTIAAVLSFIAFLFTGNSFDVAIIFSSLSLFNLLRQPLMFFPQAMNLIADARNAFDRLTPLFEAPLQSDKSLAVAYDLELALEVKGATFAWEKVLETSSEAEGRASSGKRRIHHHRRRKRIVEKKSSNQTVVAQTTPFHLRDVSLEIGRGQLVAVVGPVGSGKSSLLQGLLGEMTRLSGSVQFGGKIAYCSQVAWIQNASLRENVLFGQPFDEERYWSAIEKACLLPDLKVLPDGDLTEIGEKGINLSGGQKQRVNIARALYFDADILLLDDPLSAVDAHVGKSLFYNSITSAARVHGKTVVLVTHALHFVPEVDYIFTLEDGRLAEQGTFEELMLSRGKFYELFSEHGGAGEHEQEEEAKEEEEEEDKPQKTSSTEGKREKREDKTSTAGLITKEKRSTGSVPIKVYAQYISAGHGWITFPLIVVSAILMQTSQVLNSYLLVWWQANTFNLPETHYASIYAGLAGSQALSTFCLGAAMATMARYASYNLHSRSVKHIFFSPVAFFDVTPLGRLLGVFGKDFDGIDNQLTSALRNFSLTMSNVIGALIIVTILEHYFILAAICILLGYQYFAAYYRASAREIKRLDAMLRSLLYAHFSESLSGIPTLKAYGATPMSISDNDYYIDLEHRALFLTITNQRWLSFRLGILGALMVFVVALFAVLGVSGISPAQIGLILTYTTSLTQMLSIVTRQSADVENYMNSVERVIEYGSGTISTQEAAYEIPSNKPPPSWPQNGSIRWKDVTMSYRPNLPQVLRGVSMDIHGGEKLGVVGRTGAGKSSLTAALFRIVELGSGKIDVDGVDISKLGIRDLRSRLSIIPQEPLLFSGTIRSNLDPFSQYDDAHLWDAMRRACLSSGPPPSTVPTPGNSSPSETPSTGQSTPTAPGSRFTLDSPVVPEGLNMSVGERSLLSLARALVKDCQIVILDEATASVDLETDARIQETIRTEFSGKTLICIAHRLRTILSYDRILVMDDGRVAELDTPLNLFDKEDGIFRGMCEGSSISRTEIERASGAVVD